MKSEELLATRLQAVNTRKGYVASWKVFRSWCDAAGRQPVPASPDTMRLFLAWALYDRKYKPANLDHIFGAVKDMHRQLGFDPTKAIDHTVREARFAAKRDLAAKGLQRPSPKKAILIPQLQACVAQFGDVLTTDIRNRALLLTTFACGWRRSEMGALQRSDVEFIPEGMIVTQHHGKTDQMGRVHAVRIPFAKIHRDLCAVTAMKRWIEVRGSWAGPLFTPFRGSSLRVQRKPMWHGTIHMLVRVTLERAGIPASEYGAHSLRAGMITAAADTGAEILSIQQRSGHRTIGMVLKYVRAAQALRSDPLANAI